MFPLDETLPANGPNLAFPNSVAGKASTVNVDHQPSLIGAVVSSTQIAISVTSTAPP